MPGKRLSRRKFLAISSAAAASFALDWNKVNAFAATMGDPKNYPTVVIGAGLGGLTTAAFLARQGIPVTVFEQHNIPGGYATSFTRDGGRFEFEVSLHATAAGNNNGEERILKSLGVWGDVEMALLPEQYTVVAPDGKFRVPQKDPAGYIELLCQKFPAQKEGITGFVNYMADVAREAQEVTERNPTLEGAGFYLSFPFRYPKMFHMINRSLEDVLHRYGLKGTPAAELIVTTWPYYGLPPSRLSANYFITPTGDYMLNGAYYVKRRSQDLSNALAGVIEAAGGEVVYDTPVEKILMKDGKAAGVLAGGEKFPARAVVSNASALTTLFDLLPDGALPSRYARKIRDYEVSLSSFIVWLGLDQDVTSMIEDYEIFVASGRGAEADYESFVKGDLVNGGFLVAIYDNAYKGFSRPGTSTISIIVLTGYGPWKPFEADYRAGRKKDYYRQKEAWTNALIDRAEKQLIPGLRSMIAVKDSATPLTNWRYTANPMGAIYGFDHGLDNDFITRIKNRTPVEGLYLASAWGNPGAGYGGTIAGGEITFYQMMKDWGKG